MLDLHMHSVHSDGKDDLDALIDNLKEAGIDYFSLTDHDTAEGCRKMLFDEKLKNKLAENNMTFITGVEFTGIIEDRNVHILAYDFDIDSPAIKEAEQMEAAMVNKVNDYRWQCVKEAGFSLTEESVARLKAKKNIRKMDFAELLVENGHYPDAQTAAREFFTSNYPFADRVDACEIISMLSKAGAKMVWAHSIGGVGEKPLEYDRIRDLASKMKKLGLVGLECYYSTYTKEQIDVLLKIADELGLYVSCGSDYHGKNKPVKLAQFSCDGTPVDLSKITITKLFKK